MRKSAVLLFIAFSLLQAGPLISSFFSDQPVFVMIDEEKAKDNAETETKMKKELPGYPALSVSLSQKLLVGFPLSEQLLPFPGLEQLTPPPNYC